MDFDVADLIGHNENMILRRVGPNQGGAAVLMKSSWLASMFSTAIPVIKRESVN